MTEQLRTGDRHRRDHALRAGHHHRHPLERTSSDDYKTKPDKIPDAPQNTMHDEERERNTKPDKIPDAVHDTMHEGAHHP